MFFKVSKTPVSEFFSKFEVNESFLLTFEIQSSKSLSLLSVLVSQIFLFKIKLFKKLTMLLAKINVPLSFKCIPSFHKCSLDMLSLLTKRKPNFSQLSRKQSLTCLIIFVSFICLFNRIEEKITSLTL